MPSGRSPRTEAVGSVDWNEVTALATVVPAGGVGVALVGVWATRDAARKDLTATREAGQAAEEAARRQIEAGFRPLLIDVPRNRRITPDMEAFDNPEPRTQAALPKVIDVCVGDDQWGPIDPRAVFVYLSRVGCVSVPLRNVGRGLAVIEEGSVTIKRLGDDRLEDDIKLVTVNRPLVPVGETTRITCVFTLSPGREEATGFDVLVPYHDFAEGQQETANVYLSGSVAESWEVGGVLHDSPPPCPRPAEGSAA
jgi:hypothetical protein